MREVVLDGKRYKYRGQIQQRTVNPFAARIDTGATGYASFCQASVEEWHGMRGGIGKKYQEASGTEQLYWSEGLNTSLDGGFIAGPKINTAGAFGSDAYTAWAANTAYNKGVFRRATTYNNHIYECTTAGTSGATEPTWGTTDGGTTSDGSVTWTCRSVEIIKVFDFEGATYAVAQNMIAKWDTTTSAWVAKETGLANPLDAIVVADETDTYAVVSSSTTAKYSSDGTSWNALAGCKGFLAVIDCRLIGFYDQTINHSPRGNIDGTWETPYKLSAYLGTVHGLYAGKLLTNDEPALFLHTSRGWWSIDYWTRSIYALDDFSGYTYCGKAGIYWNSYHWIATGGGIKKYSAGMASEVGPDQDDGLPSGYQGAIFDMLGTVDETWLVYCINGGTTQKSSILRRHGTIGGNQQVYTTSAINLPITCLCYSPSSLYANGRLWWGEGINVKYCMWPDFNADPEEISGYEFAQSSGKAVFSIFRPLASFNKLAIKVMAITSGCNANNYFTVYYDIGGGWVTLGTLKSSPTPTPLDFGSGAGIEFRTIRLGIALTSNSSAATPKLKSLALGYLPYTQALRAWTFAVHVTDNDGERVFTDLEVSRDKATLLLFYPSGRTGKTGYRVKITKLPENIFWDADMKGGQIQVTVEEIFRG